MNLTFIPLDESHFPLLLKWLVVSHVKKWWDQDVKWTSTLIQEKYADYVKGYKLDKGLQKQIQAFIIQADAHPIGYIQLYNLHDFQEEVFATLPPTTAALDLFIGEPHLMHQGYGSLALSAFLQEHGQAYTHFLVAPHQKNVGAIKAFEKIGFQPLQDQPAGAETLMMCKNSLSSAVTLREMREEDYPFAVGISIQGWQHAYRGIIDNAYLETVSYSFNERLEGRTTWMQDPEKKGVVAECGGYIIGFCDFGPSRYLDYGKGEIYALYVLSAFQRSGVGDMLLHDARGYLEVEGLTPCVVITLEKNHPARKFYEKNGFKPVGHKSRAFGGKEYPEVIYVVDDSAENGLYDHP